jgi:hypothetical protein
MEAGFFSASERPITDDQQEEVLAYFREHPTARIGTASFFLARKLNCSKIRIREFVEASVITGAIKAGKY